MDNELKNLYEVIEIRKNGADEGSYTNYLFEKGKEKILKKVGEEATEVVIASMKGDKEEQINEICDLAYHLLVLASFSNIKLEEIEEELKRRSNKINNLKAERKAVDELN